MNYGNAVMNILMENAHTIKERHEVHDVMEAQGTDITNKMLTDLYKSTIARADIDFDTIPDSKGDVTKFTGFTQMQSVLNLLDEMATAQHVKIPELRTVQEGIDALIRSTPVFEKGFALNKDLLILTYNTMVYSCVVATSELISAYVEFIKSPDQLEFKLLKGPMRAGKELIANIERFNRVVKDGSFNTMANGIIKTDRNQLIGLDDFFIPAIVVGGALTIIPLIREMIFSFYYSRMKLGEYLEQQSNLLKVNATAIEASKRTLKDKKEIIKKQQKVADRLEKLSDKVKVSSKMAERDTTVNMKKEEAQWKIEDVQKDVNTSKAETAGFSFL